MNWQALWDDFAGLEDEQVQVGRVRKKRPVEADELDRIVANIAAHLDLKLDHRLLDVCCGNGLLSVRLAARCREVIGVDLSPKQIERAQAHHPAPNLQYRQGDALALREVVQGPFDRINLYFSFQYLDRFSKGRQAIQEMYHLLKPGGYILIGDVPDYEKLAQFYRTPWKRLSYHLKRALGREAMGKFWKAGEIARICQELPATLVVHQQPKDFLYAHYRQDFLIYKPA